MSPSVRVASVVVMGALLGGVAFAAVRTPPTPSTTRITYPAPPTVPTTTSTRGESPTSTVVREEVADRRTVVIHGTGDVALDPDYIPRFRSEGYAVAFAGLGGLFRADDLTVINLECTPSNLGSPLPKEFTFRCDPASLEVAARHGVDVASLANNHGGDHGPEALLDGRRNLEAEGIAPVGVGADLEEAMNPAVFEVGGWRIGVLGMGGVVPSASWLAAPGRPGMLSGDDTELMVEAVARAAAQADLVVVTIHWGWELETEPRADDRARAEAMVAAGADVIFGHHPHRLGRMETIGGRPVFWTLGNFIWPRLSDASATTAVARVVVTPDGSITGCLVPAFIERPGEPVLQAAPVCGPEDPAADPPGRVG